jgi:exopolyphosphatase/pppGpp-phosphohydrolase
MLEMDPSVLHHLQLKKKEIEETLEQLKSCKSSKRKRFLSEKLEYLYDVYESIAKHL